MNFATNDEWLILFMTHSQVERVRKPLRPRQTQVILNFFERNETGHFLSEKLLNENIFYLYNFMMNMKWPWKSNWYQCKTWGLGNDWNLERIRKIRIIRDFTWYICFIDWPTVSDRALYHSVNNPVRGTVSRPSEGNYARFIFISC